MKKIFLSLFFALAGQSMIAMEPATISAQNELSEPDRLGKELTRCCPDPELVKGLLKRGANVNYIDPKASHYQPVLMTVVSCCPELTAREKLALVKELVAHGADVNLKSSNGQNALMSTDDTEIVRFLIQEGTDLYNRCALNTTALMRAAISPNPELCKIILEALTCLTPEEKDSVKNRLLAIQRLTHGLKVNTALVEQAHLVRDCNKFIAKHIWRSLAEDMRERVIRAGALTLLRPAYFASYHPQAHQLINQHLDLGYLEESARKQTFPIQEQAGE